MSNRYTAERSNGQDFQPWGGQHERFEVIDLRAGHPNDRLLCFTFSRASAQLIVDALNNTSEK